MSSVTPPAPPGSPQAGWYRDQHGGPWLRWWDGHQWSHHLRPPPPAPPAHAGHNGRIGRSTVLAQTVFSVVLTATYGFTVAALIGDLRPYLDKVAASDGGELPPLPGSFALAAVASLVGLLAWIPMLLEIIWAYRSATAAAALGIPAKREPVWALLAWFIPVINWWFPYESIRDCLPPRHPHRRTVGRWWAGYLVGSTGVFVGIGAALVSTLALVAVVAVYAAVAAVTAMYGLRMVRAIDAAHQERLAAPAAS